MRSFILILHLTSGFAMVSKTSKSKEKKAQRKEMLAKLGAAQQLLNKANTPDTDHMQPFTPFQVEKRGYFNW